MKNTSNNINLHSIIFPWNVFKLLYQQNNKHFWLHSFKVFYKGCCHVSTQITTPTSGSFWMSIIRSRRYKFIWLHRHFHYHMYQTWENFIFARSLCWACNNQQTNIDQHSDVIIRLMPLLTSHSKPDYICCF